MFILEQIKCGGMSIDSIIPYTVSGFVLVLKIAIPIILVVLGMLDLSKAVIANEEKEMKEAQKKFIKRIIYAVVIFFVVALVQFVFGILSDADKGTESATSCISCFINKDCK